MWADALKQCKERGIGDPKDPFTMIRALQSVDTDLYAKFILYYQQIMQEAGKEAVIEGAKPF